eukprot:1559104-Amphidinium_carterae.1
MSSVFCTTACSIPSEASARSFSSASLPFGQSQLSICCASDSAFLNSRSESQYAHSMYDWPGGQGPRSKT